MARDVVDVHVTVSLDAASSYTIDDFIAWVRDDPRVGDLLREAQAIVEARGPAAVAARVAEGRHYVGSLPARKGFELMDALRTA